MVAGLTVGAADQVEVGQALDPREASLVEPTLATAFGPVVDLCGEHLGQEGQVGQPVALSALTEAHSLRPHRGQVQSRAAAPMAAWAAVSVMGVTSSPPAGCRSR